MHPAKKAGVHSTRFSCISAAVIRLQESFKNCHRRMNPKRMIAIPNVAE